MTQQGLYIDRVEGVKEFTMILKNMEEQLRRKVLKDTFKKAGKPMMITARNLAPTADVTVTYNKGKEAGFKIRPGHLKRTIRLLSAPNRTEWMKEQPAVIIKAIKSKSESITKSAYYGAFAEYGRKIKGGGETRAQKFFERAFNTHKAQFVADVHREMKLFVEKYNRK